MKSIKYTLLSTVCFLGVVLFAACSNDDDTPQAPTPSETGTFLDTRDNTTYHWVRYGNLEWTTENLRFVPSSGNVQPTLPGPREYDDGVAKKYITTFGQLYNFEAAEAAVPDGWRLPTQADWDDLDKQSNGDIKDAINLSLSGYYLVDEFFQQLHDVSYFTYIYGFYWTADNDPSKSGDNFAFYRKITYNQAGSITESMNKSNYLSVRLVRDAQ